MLRVAKSLHPTLKFRGQGKISSELTYLCLNKIDVHITLGAFPLFSRPDSRFQSMPRGQGAKQALVAFLQSHMGILHTWTFRALPEILSQSCNRDLMQSPFVHFKSGPYSKCNTSTTESRDEWIPQLFARGNTHNFLCAHRLVNPPVFQRLIYHKNKSHFLGIFRITLQQSIQKQY